MTFRLLFIVLILSSILLPLQSSAKTLEDVIDEVLNGGPENGVDLNNANPDYDYFFVHHIEFRDSENAPFSNYLNREIKFIPLTPFLLACLYYWNNKTKVETGDIYTTLEHIYIFNLKIINTTLNYHYVYLNKTWPEGNMPVPFALDVIEHKDISLVANQISYNFFKIGNREFKITSGFLAKNKL